MKHEIHVRVFYRHLPEHRIKLVKQMHLATNGSVRLGTVVRLLGLPIEYMLNLRGENSYPLELDQLVRPKDEQSPVDLNLFVEAQ